MISSYQYVIVVLVTIESQGKYFCHQPMNFFLKCPN